LRRAVTVAHGYAKILRCAVEQFVSRKVGEHPYRFPPSLIEIGQLGSFEVRMRETVLGQIEKIVRHWNDSVAPTQRWGRIRPISALS
jgi:hypothetical protein